MTLSILYRQKSTWWRRFIFFGLVAVMFGYIFSLCHAGQTREATLHTSVAIQGEDASLGKRLATVFRPDVLEKIERSINENITIGNIPGGVFWLERNGVDFVGAYGYRSLIPQREIVAGFKER